jgi:hypothetical protein
MGVSLSFATSPVIVGTSSARIRNRNITDCSSRRPTSTGTSSPLSVFGPPSGTSTSENVALFLAADQDRVTGSAPYSAIHREIWG